MRLWKTSAFLLISTIIVLSMLSHLAEGIVNIGLHREATEFIANPAVQQKAIIEHIQQLVNLKRSMNQIIRNLENQIDDELTNSDYSQSQEGGRLEQQQTKSFSSFIDSLSPSSLSSSHPGKARISVRCQAATK